MALKPTYVLHPYALTDGPCGGQLVGVKLAPKGLEIQTSGAVVSRYVLEIVETFPLHTKHRAWYNLWMGEKVPEREDVIHEVVIVEIDNKRYIINPIKDPTI